MVTTTQQLKISDVQMEQLKRQILHTRLVEKELAVLPKDVRAYEGVGRMFMLQPMTTVEKNLAEKIKSCEEKIKTIETNKAYLERSIKEGEENLRELVLSKQREHSS